MPKRKRRSSGRSLGSNKSHRKSNGGVGGESEPIFLRPTVAFAFETDDGEEDRYEWDVMEGLALLSGEESENENKKPLEKEEEENHSNLLGNSTCSSPLKRASPLSPTLFDNVLRKQKSTPATETVQLPVESTVVTTPTHVPKIEDTVSSTTVSCRSKRKQFFCANESASDNKLTDENESSSNNVLVKGPIDKQQKKSTSQKPVESCDKISVPEAIFRVIDNYQIEEVIPDDPNVYRKTIKQSKEELCRDVLYELDEVDVAWLDTVNEQRSKRDDGLILGNIEYEEMELLLDRFEKESYFELQKSGMGQPGESDEDAVCCICLDGESDNSNQIIFCDMCNIPVHQDCYGVPFIPEGSWLCRRCLLSPNSDVHCVFCPNKDGAFKQTIDGRWSHVLCALWIPEVRFANPSLIEPVDDIDDIPAARWKLICFLCKKKGVGACIQCHLRSCVTAFHVTCAQGAGLSLKVETKEQGVRMNPFCDKHTSARDLDTAKQKIETIKRVLAENKSKPLEMQFLSISHDRLAAIAELVSFPGKLVFIKRLLAYWKIKRRSRGGAPLLRDVESIWIPDIDEPPIPSKIERQPDPSMELVYFEKAQSFKTRLVELQQYFNLIKCHSEAQREQQNMQIEIYKLQLEYYYPYGIDVYLDILDKLRTKDKHGTFAEAVTEDEAPDYFTVITTPMDLSTMRKKVEALEYETIDDLEADFYLMIDNCLAYNKKSTPYYKDALKLKEYGGQVFQDGRHILEQRKKPADPINALDDSILKTEERKPEPESTEPIPYIELKYHPFQGVLASIVDKLAQKDKNGIFAEPVDLEDVPDYLTVVKNPMDFSTMRNKINSNLYPCIEALEADYFVMIHNCLEYNDEKSKFYKIGEKMLNIGKDIFDQAKHDHYMPGVTTPLISKIIGPENNNNYKTEKLDDDVLEKPPVIKILTEEEAFDIMSEILKKLIENDTEEIFMEPVTEELAPGYLDIVKSPMDLSLIEKKLKSSSYHSLQDMEKDFALMIDNCKKYNSSGTKYFNYATKMKRAGNVLFNAVRKRFSSPANE